MNVSFVKAAAVCAVLSGLTTFAVHLVPLAWAGATSFDQLVALRLNSLYLARLWMVYLHLFFVIMSMSGIALIKSRASPGPIVVGLIGYVLFVFIESSRVSLALFAVNASWRAAYATAGDEATRSAMRTLLLGWPGINDALFVLFVLGFSTGNLFYSIATWKSVGMEKTVSVALLIWAVVGFYGIARGYAGASWLWHLPEWLDYTFQPAVRFLIGAWLWKMALRE
jgi:hypothetical protein